jgi:hypothetical protein
MTEWIVGTEESTIEQAGGGLPGRGALPGRGDAGAIRRAPAGQWHAVDPATGRPACGSTRFMESWPDIAWASETGAPRCPDCLAAVPVDQ